MVWHLVSGLSVLTPWLYSSSRHGVSSRPAAIFVKRLYIPISFPASASQVALKFLELCRILLTLWSHPVTYKRTTDRQTWLIFRNYMQWLICIVNSTEFVATIYVRKKQVVTDVLQPGKTTVPKTEVWRKLTQITARSHQRSSLYLDSKVILMMERQLTSEWSMTLWIMLRRMSLNTDLQDMTFMRRKKPPENSKRNWKIMRKIRLQRPGLELAKCKRSRASEVT